MRLKISAMILFTLTLLAVVAVSGCTTGSVTTNTSAIVPSVSIASVASPGATATGLKAGLVELPNYSITINGGKISPVKLSYADLESMDFVEMDNVNMMKMSGSGIEKTGNYTGVPMMDIIAKAGMPDGDIVFVISAPDGYSMNYTASQLQDSILGLKLNGTALTDSIYNNSIVLVEPGERGPMWIMVPTSIDIIRQ